MHAFMPLESFLAFLQQRYPIQYFRSKTQVLDGFDYSRCMDNVNIRHQNSVFTEYRLRRGYAQQSPYPVPTITPNIVN